jgi:hypothetical protein
MKVSSTMPKRIFLYWRLGAFLCLTAAASATIRYVDTVSGENHFLTITAAYDGAENGDTWEYNTSSLEIPPAGSPGQTGEAVLS